MNFSFQKWISIFATWFGCGKSPYGPGTVGTIGALPLVWAFDQLHQLPYMVATFAFTIFAMFISQMHEDWISEVHDSSEIVIDEVAGLLVTMTWVPWNWKYVLLGFVLFRFFDILKPYPISYLDRRIEGGIGTVADDLAAGILGNVILQILLQKGWM